MLATIRTNKEEKCGHEREKLLSYAETFIWVLDGMQQKTKNTFYAQDKTRRGFCLLALLLRFKIQEEMKTMSEFQIGQNDWRIFVFHLKSVHHHLIYNAIRSSTDRKDFSPFRFYFSVCVSIRVYGGIFSPHFKVKPCRKWVSESSLFKTPTPAKPWKCLSECLEEMPGRWIRRSGSTGR